VADLKRITIATYFDAYLAGDVLPPGADYLALVDDMVGADIYIPDNIIVAANRQLAARGQLHKVIVERYHGRVRVISARKREGSE